MADYINGVEIIQAQKDVLHVSLIRVLVTRIASKVREIPTKKQDVNVTITYHI